MASGAPPRSSPPRDAREPAGDTASPLSASPLSAAALEARLAAAEARCAAVQTSFAAGAATPREARVAARVAAAGAAAGAALVRVPADYYEQPLVSRARLLNAPPRLLCKTLLFRDEGTGRPVASLTPYTERVNSAALARAARASGRLVLAADGEALSGYPRGALPPAPFFDAPVPLVVASSLARERILWAGGGEVTTKLRLVVRALLRAPGVSVADITLPGGEGEEGDDDAER